MFVVRCSFSVVRGEELGEILSRVASLEQGDGPGNADLFGDWRLSEGGDLRFEFTDEEGRGVDCQQHRGRLGSWNQKGFQAVRLDSQRKQLRIADSVAPCKATRVWNSEKVAEAEELTNDVGQMLSGLSKYLASPRTASRAKDLSGT